MTPCLKTRSKPEEPEDEEAADINDKKEPVDKPENEDVATSGAPQPDPARCSHRPHSPYRGRLHGPCLEGRV